MEIAHLIGISYYTYTLVRNRYIIYTCIMHIHYYWFALIFFSRAKRQNGFLSKLSRNALRIGIYKGTCDVRNNFTN